MKYKVFYQAEVKVETDDILEAWSKVKTLVEVNDPKYIFVSVDNKELDAKEMRNLGDKIREDLRIEEVDEDTETLSKQEKIDCLESELKRAENELRIQKEKQYESGVKYFEEFIAGIKYYIRKLN